MTPQASWTYEEALDFWYRRVNFELAAPHAGDLKLDRIRTLLERLGDPQLRLRVLHIAGSKGKGSTAAMLASVLSKAGYRTGLFTSPHLSDVAERIQVEGQPIGKQELVALLAEVRAVLPGPGRILEPTFFEIATALGFLYFVRRRVEAAVVEVGLGGRLDSTNVCQPEVALITSISHDHTLQLGDQLASIAREKAGIVKPGRPVVSGATAPEARAVLEAICRERGAPLRQLGVDFHYTYRPEIVDVANWPGDSTNANRRTHSPARVWIQARREWPDLQVGLLGEHQAANAAVAVACVEELRARGWVIPDRAVHAGLAEVHWPARMEIVQLRPLVVLDCAHNVASARALVETLQRSFPPSRRLLIFAGSNDKDLAGMFRELAPHFDHAFLTRYRNSPRATPPAELAEFLRQAGNLPCTLHETAASAWEAACSRANPDDLLCITGSVFLAGELRPLLIQGAEFGTRRD